MPIITYLITQTHCAGPGGQPVKKCFLQQCQRHHNKYYICVSAFHPKKVGWQGVKIKTNEGLELGNPSATGTFQKKAK